MMDLMTIQAFAVRTGIPKSTLRHYEKKGLIHPKRSTQSGYRMYDQDQVPIAKLIASLRMADISISEIQSYLQADAYTQQTITQSWIVEMKEKQKLLDISLRYLKSDYKLETVYLMEKDEAKIIWFFAEAEAGNFGKHFREKQTVLEQSDIFIHDGYFRYLSGQSSIIAQIGFGVSDAIKEKDIPDGAEMEVMNGCICISVSYQGDFSKIALAYQSLISYASEYEWVPTGSVFEWYRGDKLGDQLREVDITMPVTQIGGLGNGK